MWDLKFWFRINRIAIKRRARIVPLTSCKETRRRHESIPFQAHQTKREQIQTKIPFGAERETECTPRILFQVQKEWECLLITLAIAHGPHDVHSDTHDLWPNPIARQSDDPVRPAFYPLNRRCLCSYHSISSKKQRPASLGSSGGIRIRPKSYPVPLAVDSSRGKTERAACWPRCCRSPERCCSCGSSESPSSCLLQHCIEEVQLRFRPNKIKFKLHKALPNFDKHTKERIFVDIRQAGVQKGLLPPTPDHHIQAE